MRMKKREKFFCLGFVEGDKLSAIKERVL